MVMRWFLLLLLAGGALTMSMGCEASAEVEDDDNGDAELKIDTD
jgi:hypothetical protein